MDIRFLFVLLLSLVSCLPQSNISNGKIASSSTTSGSGSSDPTVSTTTVWNFLGTTANVITINSSNLNAGYLVGAPVESFLNTLTSTVLTNFTDVNYCLISSYTINSVTTQLRTRVVPISYYDFTSKRTVRVFRVDFQDVTNATSFCNLPIRTLNASGSYAVEAAPASIKYDPALLCTTCTSSQTSIKVRIFRNNTTTLDEVSNNFVTLTALTLKVDPNSNSAGNVGVCTNSDCISRGFDCCLDNQCVDDGATRPSANTVYPTQFLTAEAERLQNPLAYLNYPQLYYICSSTPPSTSTGGSSGGISYDAAFAQLKLDYACIADLKTLSTSTPFHLDTLINPPTHPFGTSSHCLTTLATAGQTMYYQEVMKRLYQTCGCAKTTLPDMVNNCPAYDYTVTSGTTASPNQIECYTPSVPEPSIPVNQTVTVNSRSTPHRFFDNTTGLEKVLTTTSTFTQEGDTFSYLDESYLLPSQSSFGMNSILGQMSVALDKALPAKKVAVELDQVYVIATTSGQYTPCPSCGKDSWLPSFSAFPTSNYGSGLQSSGYTTRRDELFTNTTAGNYEDTIFGRACWVPPTMLPFSHATGTTVQAQRLARLKTQAALFANGYQRDWYGFNKGALIGSFDGVTWFAIGKGRVVKSTSTSLYLAINAPFADLASPSLHVVNISQYDGISQVASVDYDPTLASAHPLQNEAGNCQRHHICTTDADCITKLGWEYACADVKAIKTNWPTFDSSGNEQLGSTSLTIDQILLQKKFPSSSTKRCLYRGSGALCSNAVTAAAPADLNLKKTITCAPNFYCAQASTSAQVFNTKISRYATNLEDIPLIRNHLYGKDANVLGRPLHYVATTSSSTSGETTTFSSDISTPIQDNFNLQASGLGNSGGLCRPGKTLGTSANPFTQHISGDAPTSARTDFISQISSCDSVNFAATRYSTCPVIDMDSTSTNTNYLNYQIFGSTPWIASYSANSRIQNACGLDTLSNNISLLLSADTLLASSPFKNIEAKTLANTSQTIVTPTLVRDACFRRAGQVCHTDLDCSPNKMHAAEVDTYPTSFFGNIAEKAYWSEDLVCGQTATNPTSAMANFSTFAMNLNRCCREVGKDLTTYTAHIPTRIMPRAAFVATDYDPTTSGLMEVAVASAHQNAPGRYNRLSPVSGIGTGTKPYLSAYQGVDGVLGDKSMALGIGSTTHATMSVMTTNQWATLSDANTNSCCGGGWIRKFADGTTDWSKRDRVVMDVANFKCINSRTRLITEPSSITSTVYDGAMAGIGATNLVGLDYNNYCNDSTGVAGSCAFYSLPSSTLDTVPVLDAYQTGLTINTRVPTFTTSAGAPTDVYFNPLSADSNPGTTIDLATTGARKNIAIKIPSFISDAFETTIGGNPPGFIFLTDSNGIRSNCVYDIDITAAGYSSPTTADNAANDCTSGVSGGNTSNSTLNTRNECCYRFDTTTRVLRVVIDDADPVPTTDTYGVRFAFDSVGSTPALSPMTRNRPGSDSFYLRRLGKLELSGIPQIVYEPLYCSDDISKLVPGIFLPIITTRTQMETAPRLYSFADGGEYHTNRYALDHDPVFSANDFKCCTPLGKTTTSKSKCCSGFATGTTTLTCALPIGANLSVYFNRFVSNEGRGTTQPGGGLVDADFNTLTGEPLISSAVNQKLSLLGNAYCEKPSVRQGGAIGDFFVEPVGPFTVQSDKIPNNFVDSINDYATKSNGGQTFGVGYYPFMSGFRWNHHLYCND